MTPFTVSTAKLRPTPRPSGLRRRGSSGSSRNVISTRLSAIRRMCRAARRHGDQPCPRACRTHAASRGAPANCGDPATTSTVPAETRGGVPVAAPAPRCPHAVAATPPRPRPSSPVGPPSGEGGVGTARSSRSPMSTTITRPHAVVPGSSNRPRLGSQRSPSRRRSAYARRARRYPRSALSAGPAPPPSTSPPAGTPPGVPSACTGLLHRVEEAARSPSIGRARPVPIGRRPRLSPYPASAQTCQVAVCLERVATHPGERGRRRGSSACLSCGRRRGGLVPWRLPIGPAIRIGANPAEAPPGQLARHHQPIAAVIAGPAQHYYVCPGARARRHIHFHSSGRHRPHTQYRYRPYSRDTDHTVQIQTIQ